jgi:hypothetical protein
MGVWFDGLMLGLVEWYAGSGGCVTFEESRRRFVESEVGPFVCHHLTSHKK